MMQDESGIEGVTEVLHQDEEYGTEEGTFRKAKYPG